LGGSAALAMFTFVVRFAFGTWMAKQIGDQFDLEGSASSTWELQR